MKKAMTSAAIGLALMLGVVGSADAEIFKVEATMTPKEQMKLDFKDGTGHFFLMVRREGKAEGNGSLAGAAVTEFGAHDITPGVGGEPRGYLFFTTSAGDESYVKWSVQATFVAGEGGKPKLLDNGIWQLNGGTAFQGPEGRWHPPYQGRFAERPAV